MVEVCQEKHKSIDEKFITHERILNKHGERIDAMEQFKSSTQVEMRNLVEQIKSLVNTIKWLAGLSFGTLLSFFIWYIQKL